MLPHVGVRPGDGGGSGAEVCFEHLEGPAAQPELTAKGSKMAVRHISALLMNWTTKVENETCVPVPDIDFR